MEVSEKEILETLEWVLELLEDDVAQHERSPYEADVRREQITRDAFATLLKASRPTP